MRCWGYQGGDDTNYALHLERGWWILVVSISDLNIQWLADMRSYKVKCTARLWTNCEAGRAGKVPVSSAKESQPLAGEQHVCATLVSPRWIGSTVIQPEDNDLSPTCDRSISNAQLARSVGKRNPTTEHNCVHLGKREQQAYPIHYHEMKSSPTHISGSNAHTNELEKLIFSRKATMLLTRFPPLHPWTIDRSLHWCVQVRQFHRFFCRHSPLAQSPSMQVADTLFHIASLTRPRT